MLSMTFMLSAFCIAGVDGIPILTLSIGETFRLLRGTRTVSTGVSVFMPFMLDESVFMPFMLEESVLMLDMAAALSACWLCVGVGAAAPVPYCIDEESVVVVVLAAGAGIGSGAGAGSAAGAGAGSAAGAGVGAV